MARWYDTHGKLKKNIGRLQFAEKNLHDFLLSQVMKMIRQHDPRLLDKFVERFPLDIQRRRWYDRDPYLWLIINGLHYAGKDLLDKVADLLETEQDQAQDGKEEETDEP